MPKRMPPLDGNIYCYYHKCYEDPAAFYRCPSKERGFSNACREGDAEQKAGRPGRRGRKVVVLDLPYRLLSPVNFY